MFFLHTFRLQVGIVGKWLCGAAESLLNVK